MKFIIVFIMLILLISSVYASETVIVTLRPSWKDICPEGLADSEYKEIKWYWPYGVKETQAEINYWANKRFDFESRLNDCDVLLDFYKEKCYINLQEKYNDDFELHRFEAKQKRITESAWRDFNYRGVKPIMIEINPVKKNLF